MPVAFETSIGEAFSAVSRRVGDRAAVVQDERVVSFDDLRVESFRVASALIGLGATYDGEIDDAPNTLRQPVVALLATDRPEMVITLAAVYLARAVPVTINFRFQVDEVALALRQIRPVVVFTDAGRLGVLLEAVKLATIDPTVICYDQAADDVPGYDEMVASAPDRPLPRMTGDDRCLLLTGGTTGSPKGVIWRQADVFMRAMGGVDPSTGLEHASLESIVRRAEAHREVVMSLPPLMHPYGQWIVFRGLVTGGTTILGSASGSFNPGRAVQMCDEWGVGELAIAGDAFAVPLLHTLEASRRQLPALRVIRTGSVGMSTGVKRRLHAALPDVAIAEVVGGTEQTGMLTFTSHAAEQVGDTKVFAPMRGTVIVAESRNRLIPFGDPEIGLLARTGRHPIGYLDDADASDGLFATLDGARYLVTGDRASWTREGGIELLGRGSQVINTGGEKVNAEEVDAVLLCHPEVGDAISCGIPHERWGAQVAAAVALVPGATTSPADLMSFARERLAAYKVPRHVVVVPEVKRSPVGKPDYRWAQQVLTEQ